MRVRFGRFIFHSDGWLPFNGGRGVEKMLIDGLGELCMDSNFLLATWDFFLFRIDWLAMSPL